MSLSNKALLLGTAGFAALALVGTGVGASFTDTATASTQVQTGTVHLALSPVQVPTFSLQHGWQSLPLPAFSEVDNQLSSFSPLPITAGQGSEQNSVTVAQSSNVGSQFWEAVPLMLTNTGTLPLHSLTLSVSDVPTDLLTQTQAIVCSGGPANALGIVGYVTSALKGGSGCTAPASLASLSSLTSILPNSGVLAPTKNNTEEVTIVMTSPAGGYANSAEQTTINPTFTVTGADVS